MVIDDDDCDGCSQLSVDEVELSAVIEASFKDVTNATDLNQVSTTIASTEHDGVTPSKKARKDINFVGYTYKKEVEEQK